MGNDYWNRRNIKDKARSINRGEDYIRKQQKHLYEKASREIGKEIENLYQRFANQEDISLAEAKQKIAAADFRRIDWDGMIQKSQEQLKALQDPSLPSDLKKQLAGQHAKLEEQMRVYARRGSISYLEQKNLEINRILVNLYDEEQLSMYDFLENEWDDGYYRSIYNTQQRIGFGYDFITPNEEAINQAIFQTFDKRNFSRSLYKHCETFSQDLKENLVTGLIRGEGIDKMARRISKRMDVAYSRARTLVRTETANIFEQATYQGYKDCGIEWYEYLATLDNRTSEICRELDGKHFKIQDAVPGVNYPPMHPNCRSTTVVWFPDEEGKKSQSKRIAKSEAGKYYEVPADTTYEKWRGEHFQSQLFMLNGENAASLFSDVEFADTHKELEKYLLDKYHIAYDKNMENLDLNKVKLAVKGMERVFNRFDGLSEPVQIFTAAQMSGGNIMSCNVSKITFNKRFFTDRDSKSFEIAGCHEAAHLLEWKLIVKMGYKGQEIEDKWNNHEVINKFVQNSISNIQKKNPNMNELRMIQNVSSYAAECPIDRRYSECFAESVRKVLFDGKKAPILAKQIYQDLRREIR